MTTVAIFHHALGITDGLVALGDRVESFGCTVALPDLFGGSRPSSLEDGIELIDGIGMEAIGQRGVDAVAQLDHDLVVVGFSVGVVPAQRLAQTDPRVVGAVLCDAALPLGVFGDEWPCRVPVRIHLVDGDPFAAEDLDAARDIARQAVDGELIVHSGSGHLVTDPAAEAHDPALAERILDEVVSFVAELHRRLDD